MKVDEENEDVKMDIDWFLLDLKYAYHDVLVTYNLDYSDFS